MRRARFPSVILAELAAAPVAESAGGQEAGGKEPGGNGPEEGEAEPKSQFGICLTAGDASQLAGLQADPLAQPIVSYSRALREFDLKPAATARSTLNGWLTGRGLPTLSAGVIWREGLDAVIGKAAPGFSLAGCSASDSD